MSNVCSKPTTTVADFIELARATPDRAADLSVEHAVRVLPSLSNDELEHVEHTVWLLRDAIKDEAKARGFNSGVMNW